MIAAFLLAAALASPAAADSKDSGHADVMAKLAPAFKGTIVSTYPDGRTGHLLLSPGHTYRYSGRTGVKSGGAWALNDGGDKICLKQKQPHALPIGYCTVIPSGKSWSAKAVDGEMVTLHVAPGRS